MRISLLCVGFYAALRRSELAALNIGDISFHHAFVRGHSVEYANLCIRRSKTDQTFAGQNIVLPPTGRSCCPVLWLRRQLQLRRLSSAESPLFTTDSGQRLPPAHVAFIVKDVVATVAPSHVSALYAGHSLRRGGLTALSTAGAPDAIVQRHARHKDYRSTAKYLAPPLSALVDAFRRA